MRLFDLGLHVLGLSVTIVTSRPAAAWDGVTPPPLTVNASGLALGPKIVAGSWPVWVDRAGRMIGLDQISVSGTGEPVFGSNPPSCWQVDGTQVINLGWLVDPIQSPGGGFPWHIAARAGSDDLFALAFHPVPGAPAPWPLGSVVVHRVSCDAPSEELATVSAPEGTPGARGAIPPNALALGADDVVYLVYGDLVRIDLGLDEPTWDVLATTADLEAALALPPDRDAAFVAAGLTGDGRLWVTFETFAGRDDDSPRSAIASGVVEVGDDGRLVAILGPDDRLTGMSQVLHTDSLDAMLIATPTVTLAPVGRHRALAVLAEHGPLQPGGRSFPWPLAAPLSDEGLVGGFDGSVYARALPWIQPLAFLPELADFDRDRVSARREAELGLSDQAYDSDGDGFNDGAELGLLATDPRDPQSHPSEVALADVSYGPSLLIGESELLSRHASVRGDPERLARLPPLVIPSADGSLQCALDNLPNPQCPPYEQNSLVQSVACVDRERAQSCVHVYAGGIQPSPDGRWGFAFRGEGPDMEIVRVEIATGELVRPFPAIADLDVYDGVIYALSGEAILLTHDFREVVRIDPTGATVVLTTAVDGCVVAPGSDALAPCADPTPIDPAGGAMRAVGHHRPTNSWVFSFPPSYVAVSEDGVGFVQDHLEVADGLELEVLRAIPGGGQLAKGARNVGGAFWNGSYLLPDLFSSAEGPPQEHVLGEAGDWFFHGFLGMQVVTYRQEQIPAGCLPKVPCEYSFAPPIIDVGYELRAEWVPVPPVLEAGEILFATQQHFSRRSGIYRQPDGSYDGLVPEWRLGRITRLGAVVEWLDAHGFAALADVAARALLTATPLGRVDALAASPDGLRLCIAESGRVWEITLAAGRAGSIALADQGPGMVGCAYDASGRLARLAASPAVIHVGADAIPGPADRVAYGLVRAGDRWLVRGEGAREPGHIVVDEAYCVDDAGGIQPTGHRMIALAEIPDGVAFIDELGHAWVGRSPCGAGGFPDELLAQNLWVETYIGHGWSRRGELQVSNGALAMRPDGLFAVANRDLDVFGDTKLFSLEPMYRPLEGAVPIAAHDPFRRATPRAALLSTWAIGVTAMVTLPGAGEDDDWGHFEPPPAPHVFGPEAGAEVVEGAEVAEPARSGSSDDDGCGSGSGGGGPSTPLALALTMLALRLGRKVRRQRHDHPRDDLRAA